MKGHSMKWLTVLVIVIAVAASILAALLYAAGGREDDNANLTRFGAIFQKRSAILIPHNSVPEEHTA